MYRLLQVVDPVSISIKLAIDLVETALMEDYYWPEYSEWIQQAREALRTGDSDALGEAFEAAGNWEDDLEATSAIQYIIEAVQSKNNGSEDQHLASAAVQSIQDRLTDTPKLASRIRKKFPNPPTLQRIVAAAKP